MDDAIQFLRAFADAHCQTRRAMYTEPDDRTFIRMVWALDAMYFGERGSGLSRPSSKPASAYAAPARVDAAARQRSATLFAVARYDSDGADLFRAWMGHGELGRRGDGIYRNHFAARVAGEYKVVASYSVCSGCWGTGIRDDGRQCRSCEAVGWYDNRDLAWPSLGDPVEVRRFAVPTDPRYDRTYEAIPGGATDS